jgi:hypothetical protein
MGDAAPADPVATLAAQVNRFGASAPVGYQFVTTPFAPPMSMGLATAALTIYQRRATDAYSQFHDAGSQAAIDAANAGFSDPVSFVMGHLSEVISTVATFADALGIPGAGANAEPADTGTSTGSILLAAGILGLWWLMEGKR